MSTSFLSGIASANDVKVSEKSIKDYHSITNTQSTSGVQKAAASQKRIDESKEQFLAMILTMMKHQTPDEPQEVHHMVSMFASMEQTQQAIDTNRHLAEINKKLGGNGDAGAARDLIGMEAEIPSISNAILENSGANFNFFIDGFDPDIDLALSPAQRDSSLGISKTVECKLLIKDQNGNVVREEDFANIRDRKFRPGPQQFHWNGVVDKGCRVTRGQTYSLEAEVTVKTRSNGRIIEQTKLPNKPAIVESVEVDNDGNVALKLSNGKIVNKSDVVKFSSSKGLVGAGKSGSEENFSYLSSLLSNKVTVNDSNINVGKAGEASFNFHNNDNDEAGLIVRLYDEKNQEVSSWRFDKDEIKKGENSLKFIALKTTDQNVIEEFKINPKKNKTPKLPQGVYRAEFFKDINNDGSNLVKIDNEIGVVVSAVNMKDGTITAGDKIFKTSDITYVSKEGISEPQYTDNFAIDKLLHKNIQIDTSNFTLGSEETFEWLVPLGQLLEGEHYNSGNFTIFDKEGNKVDNIYISSVKLKEVFRTPPSYNELSIESKSLVDEYINKKYGDKLKQREEVAKTQATMEEGVEPEIKSFTKATLDKIVKENDEFSNGSEIYKYLNNEERNHLKQFIESGFRLGEIKDQSFDKLDSVEDKQEELRKNAGYYRVKWTSPAIPEGNLQDYIASFTLEKHTKAGVKGNSDTIIEEVKVPLRTGGQVDRVARSEDGKFIPYIGDAPIDVAKIISIS